MIAVSKIAKRFGGQTLFEGVSLGFHRGNRYGVVGANGSGKSTLLQILSGDDHPSAGEVSRPNRAVVGVRRRSLAGWSAVTSPDSRNGY